MLTAGFSSGAGAAAGFFSPCNASANSTAIAAQPARPLILENAIGS
jgi:hypothetical protein